MAEPKRWTPRQKLAVSAFVVYLAVQLIVPTVALLDPDRPGRFGWQMYSGSGRPPKLATIHPDGEKKPVPLARHFAVLRREIDYQRHLIPLLQRVCAASEDAVGVRIESADGQQMVRVLCR